MKVLYTGKTSKSFTHGKLYIVLSVEQGYYRVLDDNETDMLIKSDLFEVI